MRSDVYIVLRSDRIQSIETSVPSGARVIDLSKQTVLPGFCDCHAHIVYNPKDESPAALLMMSSAQAALWGVRNIREWLSRGFTMLREAGETDTGYSQLAVRNSVRIGLIPGPRIQSAGNMVSVSGGHGDVEAGVIAPDQELPRRPNLADTVDEVAKAVRRDIKYGADWIKLIASGGVMDPNTDFNVQELSDEQMAEAVRVAHRAGKKVMAHAHAARAIRGAVLAGADSVEHGALLDDPTAALMAKQGTWLVPTLYTLDHGAEIGASRGASPEMVEKGKALLKLRRAGMDAAIRNRVRIVNGVDLEPKSLRRSSMRSCATESSRLRQFEPLRSTPPRCLGSRPAPSSR